MYMSFPFLDTLENALQVAAQMRGKRQEQQVNRRLREQQDRELAEVRITIGPTFKHFPALIFMHISMYAVFS